jgi:transcriptional regulator with XRE-family HTH domain
LTHRQIAASQEEALRRAIGRRLKQLRLSRQAALGREIDLKEIAADLGVTGSAVGQWELGRGKPTMVNLEALARYWGVHPGWLAFGWEPRTGEPPDSEPADKGHR